MRKGIHRSHKHWTPEEDQKLKDLVKDLGPRKWKIMATKMVNRDAKQCRERYHGHLEDNINKNPLSQEEDDIVVRDRNLGYGWAQIARNINETLRTLRTPNQIKNNFNQRLKRIHPSVKPDKKNVLAPKKSIKIFKPISKIPQISGTVTEKSISEQNKIDNKFDIKNSKYTSIGQNKMAIEFILD